MHHTTNRILTIVLCLAMLLSFALLAGCGGGKEDNAPHSAAGAAASAETAPAEDIAAETAELDTIPGSVYDPVPEEIIEDVYGTGYTPETVEEAVYQ